MRVLVHDAWRIPVVGESWRVVLVVPAVGYALTFVSVAAIRWLLLLAAAGLAASVVRARLDLDLTRRMKSARSSR
jgi:hypothetical protein